MTKTLKELSSMSDSELDTYMNSLCQRDFKEVTKKLLVIESDSMVNNMKDGTK